MIFGYLMFSAILSSLLWKLLRDFSSVWDSVQVSELYKRVVSTYVLYILTLWRVLRRLDLKKCLNFLIGCHTLAFLAVISFFVSSFVPSNLISLYDGSGMGISGGMRKSQ